MFKKTFAALIFASVFAVFLVTTPLLEGQVVPYKASGSNAQFNPFAGVGMGTYCGSGKGTHLGRHQIKGEIFYGPDFVLNFGAIEGEVFAEGSFTGTQTATAANGDTLSSTLSGTVKLIVGVDGKISGTWFPTFVLTGSDSGRFENSSGTIEGVAINPPFDRTSATWPFDWFIDGEFDLGKKKKK